MKKLSLIFALFALSNAEAQDFPIDAETKKIDYTEVVPIMTTDKNTLYLRAKAWAASNASLTKVEDNDAETKSVSKGQMKVKYPAPMRGYFHEGMVNYTVTIAAKDGKYKYNITNIHHTSDRGNGGKLESNLPECGKYTLTMEGWGTIKNYVKAEMPKLVESLKAGMAKMPTAAADANKSKDNW